jgi:hypothetical protein
LVECFTHFAISCPGNKAIAEDINTITAARQVIERVLGKNYPDIEFKVLQDNGVLNST